jgi:hypothetical protein
VIFRSAKDPDTGRTVDFLPVEVEWLCELSLNPVRDPGNSLGVIPAFDEDHELVSAQSRDDIRRSHTIAEPLGDPDQKLIADQMAKTVIYKLKPIEVDKQHAYLILRILPAAGKGFLEASNEQGSVWQAGECVVSSFVLQLLLGDLFVRYVLELEDQVRAIRTDIA